MRVQYGCGLSAPEGWLNFDASPTLRFERLPLVGQLYTRNKQRFPRTVRYGDIVRGLPIAAASCTAVYASHVLEHLALDEFHRALRNTHGYLAPGGTFRLVVPDLEQLCRDYLASGDSHRFMEDSCLGHSRRLRGITGLARQALGNSSHLWMWDEKSMRAALVAAGFVDVRRADFGDSHDPSFAAVEDSSRFAACLAMQCRKGPLPGR